ncbi:MAG: thioesterase family protein [Eubacteriales bacterium]|nr:thioesterase family protein [Eubacteriales bacterium]
MNQDNIGRLEGRVTPDTTARAMGSGSLPVYATPAMIALMEGAACAALAGQLDDGVTTVGTFMQAEHLSATPVGMRVWAEATLTHSDGRTYTFAIDAYDEAGLIGKAQHKRASVKSQRFLEKAQAKGQA